MNKIRRLELGKLYDELNDIRAQIEEVMDQEQGYADNMPDNLQDSEKHEKAEEVVGKLVEAMDYIQSALDEIEAAKENPY